MTRRAGMVRVAITARAARRAALFLRRHRTVRPTLLVDRDEARQRALRTLARSLLDASRYERKAIDIERRLAEAMLGIEWRALDLLACVGASDTIAFVTACRGALKPRGRPRRTPGRTKQRIAHYAADDDRALRRLRAEQRVNEWVDDIGRRGESLLTTRLPPP